MTAARQLGRFGVWRSASLVTPQLAADIERLGYGTLWLGSSPAGDLVQAEELLDATTTLTVATSIWSEDDLSGDGGDKLIDALVAQGSPAEIAGQLTRHLDAGADHVCLHLITEEGTDPLPGYRALAPALGLS